MKKYIFATDRCISGEFQKYIISAESLTKAFQKAAQMNVVVNRKIRNFDGSLSKEKVAIITPQLICPRKPLIDGKVIFQENDGYHSPEILTIFKRKNDYLIRKESRTGSITFDNGNLLKIWKIVKQWCRFNNIQFSTKSWIKLSV